MKKILGISGLDSSPTCALFIGDQIHASLSEESIRRKTNSTYIPVLAIEECLTQAGIQISDIDYVVLAEKPMLRFYELIEDHFKLWPKGFRSFCELLDFWLGKQFRFKKLLTASTGYKGPVIYLHRQEAATAEEAALYAAQNLLGIQVLNQKIPEPQWNIEEYLERAQIPFSKIGETKRSLLREELLAQNKTVADFNEKKIFSTDSSQLLSKPFNLNDQPLVYTPQNAFQCFAEMKIDHLIMGDCLVSRSEIPFLKSAQ